MYLDSIKIEKKGAMGPGSYYPYEFKMFPNNRVQLSENLVVKFSCELKFNSYPFDEHKCNLAFYDREYVYNILLNQVQKIGTFFIFNKLLDSNHFYSDCIKIYNYVVVLFITTYIYSPFE